MSELEPKLGNIADTFKLNTDSRINISELKEPDTRFIFEVLQDEIYKSLRLLENAIISNK